MLNLTLFNIQWLIVSLSPPDEATLLLYLLLHRNKGFHNYVLASTEIDRLVIPILQVGQPVYQSTSTPCQTLYRAPDCSNHHIYMSLIILLILSEDDLFNQTVHSCILRPTQVSCYCFLAPATFPITATSATFPSTFSATPAASGIMVQ